MKTVKAFSSNSIKEKIRKIILHENKKAPYSDNRIKDILKKNGIDIARRTITKYRESLNIDSCPKERTNKIFIKNFPFMYIINIYF